MAAGWGLCQSRGPICKEVGAGTCFKHCQTTTGWVAVSGRLSDRQLQQTMEHPAHRRVKSLWKSAVHQASGIWPRIAGLTFTLLHVEARSSSWLGGTETHVEQLCCPTNQTRAYSTLRLGQLRCGGRLPVSWLLVSTRLERLDMAPGSSHAVGKAGPVSWLSCKLMCTTWAGPEEEIRT